MPETAQGAATEALESTRGKAPVERLALTPTEAAQALGVGRTLVYELLAAGELPGRRLAGRWVVPVAGLQEWLNAQPESA